MPSFSQMKFSRKVFLTIFGMATFTAIVISTIVYESLSKGRSQDFAESYIDHMNLFAKTLAGVEASQSQIAKNAAEVIRHQGALNDRERQEMARYLGVDEINFYSSRKDLLKLFPSLPDYAGGPSSVYQTEMILGGDGKVGQHTLVASKDGKRIIEVMMDFDDITQLLRAMAQHDEDNLSLELVNANQESLFKIRREDFQDTVTLAEALTWKDGVHWQKDRLIVLTPIIEDGKVKNRLVTTISTRTLQNELRKIQQILIMVSLGLILISWILSKILTKILLGKIESIRTTLAKITTTQNYSERVPVSHTDENHPNELEQLGQNLNRMLETMQSHQSRLLEAERDKAKSQIAAQVAHDIRSPLMSMNMALSQIENVALEPLALIKSAVARISGIVQKLSATSAKTENTIPNVEAPKLTLVEPLIASVVNEHRVRKTENQNLTVYGFNTMPNTWSVVQVSELQTALSNLINNAFEAGANEVVLNFRVQGKEWILEIKDNGKGIPQTLLEKIFERSFTHGKATGTGLGLFQAKTAIEWSGGNLKATSEEGRGTTFTLTHPLEKKPSWAPVSLEIQSNQEVFFVDDDHHVLMTWQERALKAHVPKVRLFSSAETFLDHCQKHPFPADAILVIDQNLGSTTGLNILSEMNLGPRGILCTTDFDEKSVQDQVKKLKVFLIPKIWISQIEIKVRNS
ncbi:hypothetical protein AZI86_15960 [Bdellovibrio bacteriovorus]|uniref:histidine kinase n=1 Tax=Bdellovibrio bacteriovorus TaxID=959 RepID=A0A150WI25_BDEBC|nr:hybrid sensor histidine kinase/response regulator [Bdellovibrio bacteriovorus]KYG63197.1 hypothetical protein AZI86_15960 [Bdellovibrio bacteriovorus]